MARTRERRSRTRMLQVGDQAPDMPLPVQFGMLLPHRLCLFPRAFDLDQRALADSRTILGRLRPCPRVVHQLGPEWENPALGRLRRMDPAAAIVQKVAVRAPRHAQPHTVARAVYILTLESSRTHPGEPGRTHQVRLRQVDKPLLLAAFRTSRSEERRVGKECRSRWSPY